MLTLGGGGSRKLLMWSCLSESWNSKPKQAREGRKAEKASAELKKGETHGKMALCQRWGRNVWCRPLIVEGLSWILYRLLATMPDHSIMPVVVFFSIDLWHQAHMGSKGSKALLQILSDFVKFLNSITYGQFLPHSDDPKKHLGQMSPFGNCSMCGTACPDVSTGDGDVISSWPLNTNMSYPENYWIAVKTI